MDIKTAQKVGYYLGYQQGITKDFYDPNPDLAIRSAGIFINTYLEAYEQGFQKARSDKQLILRGRVANEEHALNVERDR